MTARPDLDNQNVVVIGGTSGIGLATACAARDLGANVWAAGRSADKIDEARAAGISGIEFVRLDTHDTKALDSLFDEVGTIGHLVSAATGATRTTAPFLEQTPEQFAAAFDKFWGYANVVRHGVPHVREDGSIVLVSGIPSRKCNPNMSSLSCVGAAVEALGRALAVELAPRRVNVVAPGIIDTAMFDWMGDNREAMLAQMGQNNLLKRVGDAEEVANAIIYLLTTPFATGTTVDVDGGQLLP